jgi:pyruvate/2-oxoglutarate dehydrogenase complex dihydrolipoamide dehydrogenase (E3) component
MNLPRVINDVTHEKIPKSRGMPYTLFSMSMAKGSRAYKAGETKNFMKVLVAPEPDRLLAASVLGR